MASLFLNTKFTSLSCLLILIQLHSGHGAHLPGLSRDRASLLSFASIVFEDPSNSLENWNSTDTHVCNWTGVSCNPVKERVVQLDLSGRDLRGTISPALSNLSFLAVLDLSGNFFSGGVPAELGALFRLKQLSLASNLLEGTIPAELGFLGRLVYLDLGGNQLVGEIPKTLLCNCTSLQYIDLSNNSLSGEIPLGNECRLMELRFLLLWSNRLTGRIPPALSNSSKLEWIDLESNYLGGELPSEIVDKMPFLQFLYLSYNNLTSHDTNTNLKPFFASLVNCSNLQELELAGNNLGGEIPSSLVGDLSTNLLQLHLEENRIWGPIPPNISNLVNLTYLNLSNNFLNGSIPPDISGLRKLERVYLSNNLLSGEIPPAIGDIPHLGLLDISGNRLSGSIPDTLSNLSQLRRLLLHNNQLSGTIPPSLGKCINLEILDLSYNRLTGMIPIEVAELSLKLYLNLSSNYLKGSLPLELSKMDMILALDLSSNNLSGTIPPQLASCVALEYLNLSDNSLTGSLPSSIGSLPYLQVLDLSSNGLEGTLPESLQSSSTLKQLNVSFNNFSGVVQNEGVFALLRNDSFLGNPGLCGSLVDMSACPTKRARRFVILPILLTLIGTPCLLCLFGSCPLISRTKSQLPIFHRAILEDEEEVRKNDYPRISYRKLVEATDGFAESNLIGSGRFGRVYKGILGDETRIAVKVLDPKIGGEILESFKRECQVLKRTRHRNLIRIITACSRPDFKALVLPLMPNGSLESHLYPCGSPGHSLNLIQVVSITSDIAEGMAYLHHYSPVKVIHCDLKPSNVLLDDEMTALVSDFGIARLVKGGDDEGNGTPDSSPCNSTTGLLQGSVGYIAPEYGLGGNPSTQGDIYSFGVLLLEIVTGKRPTDLIFQEGLTLNEWVKNHYPHNIEPIIAHSRRKYSLLTDTLYQKKLLRDVMVELIELGLVCTQFSPSMRPTMIDVAHEIALLKEDLSKHAIDTSEQSSSVTDLSF